MKQNVQNRIRKVSQPERTIRFTMLREITQADVQSSLDADYQAVQQAKQEDAPQFPHDWTKGALLNVRNAGECYNVTLYPEESDPRHPERTLKFSNPAKCQDFVSKWYARESHNPLAR